MVRIEGYDMPNDPQQRLSFNNCSCVQSMLFVLSFLISTVISLILKLILTAFYFERMEHACGK